MPGEQQEKRNFFMLRRKKDKAINNDAAIIRRPEKKNGRIFLLYALCFLLPVVIMYAAYALFGVHPYGDGSVLVLDLNGQYVYYYEAYRDALLGDGSLMYSWSRNLSGDMFGIFAYYLASPFMILVCLFPRTAMCGAIETIQLLKIGTAAVTFAVFLRKTSDKLPKNTSVVIFSSMYSLMAYMVVQLMDPMWLDGLIYLPLICLGVRRLLDKGKMIPLIIPLSLMFIAHFYIGYMIGFFTFLYFLFCFFSQSGRRLPERPLIRILQFGFSAVTAVFISCCVIIPVYKALSLGKLEFSDPDWSMATQFDFLSVITKLFPLSYDTVYPSGMPMLYCGAAVLILVPLYFMNKKISIKRKASSGLLLAVMFIVMYIRPVDIVWHGFQVPNWLPFRYSFVISFLMLVMASESFENLDGITPKEIGGIFFALLVYLFWCEREQYSHFYIFTSVTGEDGEVSASIGGIWFSMIALAVYFLLLYLYRKYRNCGSHFFRIIKASDVLSAVICIAVSLELLLNAMDTLKKIDDDVVYSDYTSYEPYMSDTIDAVNMINEFDDSEFFRMEATFHRMVCDPIGVGYYGISHSSSVMNAPALLMLQQLGYGYGGNYTSYEGTTLITDSVFGIKYLMDKVDEDGGNVYADNRTSVPEQYKLATHIEEKNATYKFYRNPYALSLGTVCKENITEVELLDDNPFENQNLLYSALDSQTEITEYFTRIMPKNSEMENVSVSTLSDGKETKKYQAIDSDSDAHVDYVIQMDKDSDLYMYLPTSYERTCNIWTSDEETYQNGDGSMDYAGQFFVGDNYSILNLGSFVKDQEVRIRITIANDDHEAFWSDALFYSFDLAAFEETAFQIQENCLEITEFENSGLSGVCYAESGGEYLFTTIPYQEGWIVTVNGEEVSPEISLGSLITIPLEEGENVITMKFSPGYYKLGWAFTILGVFIGIVIFLFEYKDGAVIRKIKKK